MARNLIGIIVAAFYIAPVCYSQDIVPKDSPKDAQAIQGLWIGAYGGGAGDGIVYQPSIAELLIKGDHIEVYGRPDTVAGTFRLDPKAKRMQITPTDSSGGKPPAKTVDYGYEIKGDKLNLTCSDNQAQVFHKSDIVEDPLANAQVELVAAQGINGSGDLLVTEFTQLQAGRAHATYFRPQKQSLKTKGATVLVVQKTGCKRISLDEARGLIRNTVPVVITYRRDDGRPPEPVPSSWHLKEIGPPSPDAEAVARVFSRILQPGTLVFVLSAKENVPMP